MPIKFIKVLVDVEQNSSITFLFWFSVLIFVYSLAVLRSKLKVLLIQTQKLKNESIF